MLSSYSVYFQFPDKPTRQQRRDAKELVSLLNALLSCFLFVKILRNVHIFRHESVDGNNFTALSMQRMCRSFQGNPEVSVMST